MSTSSLPLSNDSSNKERHVEGFSVGYSRKQPARRQFLQLMHEHFGVKASEHYNIPYLEVYTDIRSFSPGRMIT